MARPRVLAVLLASAVMVSTALLVDADRARADTTVLATEWAPSKVSRFGGMTAWSRLNPRTGRYSLIVHDGSREIRPPIDPRTVPFDVDLGRDRFGQVVATYSRCKREPRLGDNAPLLPARATARRCDVYIYSLAKGSTRIESKLDRASIDGASEFFPSIWRGNVAFARVYEKLPGPRGDRPHLYVRRLDGSSSSDRQPGGPRGSTGVGSLTALELRGRRLAFTWTYTPTRGGDHRSEVRLDTLNRGHRVVAGVRDRSSTRFALLTPSLSHGKVYWATDCIGPMCGMQPRSAFMNRQRVNGRRGAERLAFLTGPERVASAAVDKGGAALVLAQGYSITNGRARCRSADDPQRSRTPGCRVLLRDDFSFGPPRA